MIKGTCQTVTKLAQFISCCNLPLIQNWGPLCEPLCFIFIGDLQALQENLEAILAACDPNGDLAISLEESQADNCQAIDHDIFDFLDFNNDEQIDVKDAIEKFGPIFAKL